MSEFNLFFRLGIEHVADVKNHHHIFFLVSLFVIYNYQLWLRVLFLLLAFTIGHSLSILAAFFNIPSIPSGLIRFIIPLLVLTSSILNFMQKSDKFRPGIFKIKFLLILLFGMIHGLEFYQDLIRIPSKTGNFAGPLLFYNLGIETAQVSVTLLIITLTLMFTGIMKIKKREWNLILSGIACGAAIVMMIEYFPQ